jgi:hypothetical protein
MHEFEGGYDGEAKRCQCIAELMLMALPRETVGEGSCYSAKTYTEMYVIVVQGGKEYVLRNCSVGRVS